MAKCIIHNGEFGNDSVCPRCRACTHQNFWQSLEDFKNGIFRCNGCYKVFRKIPEGKEVWVLADGKWMTPEEAGQLEVNVGEIEPNVGDVGDVFEEVKLKVCPVCAVEFSPKRLTAKFCSESCKQKNKRIMP